MDSALITILNMSLTGAFVIAAIVIARLALKKAPKMISYCLWAVAGFRLAIPFSIESALSLMPFKAQPIAPSQIGAYSPLTAPAQLAAQSQLAANSQLGAYSQPIAQTISEYTHPQLYDAVSSSSGGYPWLAWQSAGPLQILLSLGAYIWLAGMAVMLICGVVSFLRLKRQMRGAKHLYLHIYEADNLETPFVLGIIHPVIYIPAGLSATERKYIILHEQTHIMRRDHLIKFAAYAILCVHWFNPLAWAAFLLMGVDMEMSCDERVLKEMGADMKKDYSRSLIRLATQRRFLSGSPLAFGEGGVTERVKNILSYGKTSRLITILAVAASLVFSIGFSVDRTTGEDTITVVGSGPISKSAQQSKQESAQEYNVLDAPGESAGTEDQPDNKTQNYTGSHTRSYESRRVSYMALNVHETGTDSLAKLMNSDSLPYDRYYCGMTRQGEQLIISYIYLK